MDKRDEIQEGLTILISECYSKEGSACKLHSVFQPQKFLNKLFPYLHEQGVVLKVEGELPETEIDNEEKKELEGGLLEEMAENWRLGGRRPSAEFAGKRLGVLSARKQKAKTLDVLKEAGYTLTIPLIEEEK